MFVSIPATIFENHNALMLLATSNLWALLWSSPCQVHWRTIGWMMVGQFLSNQLWCAVGLSCCWWFDQRRRGSCETFRSFDQRALLCGENPKPWLLLLVCSLNIVVWQKESLWKSPILKSLSPVKSHPSWPTYPSITYSQISRPRTPGNKTPTQQSNISTNHTLL